jgi:tripartite-type tricarboxylate transporter receptor subunit TctC
LSAITQVPTLLEQGLDLTVMTWYGLMVRAGTPKTSIDAIVQAIEVASKDPQVLNTMHHDGATPLFSSPASFAREAQEEFALVKPLLSKYLLSNEQSAAPAK